MFKLVSVELWSSRVLSYSKELGHDTSSTLQHVEMWGPSIRTVVALAEDLTGNAQSLARYNATRAAMTICALHGNITQAMMTHQVSDLVFHRPGYDKKGKRCHYLEPCIPTEHLAGILEEHRTQAHKALTNDQSLAMFAHLSRHVNTRSADARIVESRMHARLLVGTEHEERLRISKSVGSGVAEHWLEPVVKLLPGTLAALGNVGDSTSFYWIPLLASSPGIDAVLGDGKGRIFALQAATQNAEDHCSPVAGLRSLWSILRPEVRSACRLHMVVVADRQETADDLVLQFSKDIQNQWTELEVEIWGSNIW